MSADRRRPTIVDVARLAQVSTGTVSNVLANHRPVKLRTRRRVEAAVAELNYRPNRIAQSLTGQPTRVIGMVVPDVTNPFFSELMLGAETELEQAGYAVVFGNSHGSVSRQNSYLRSFRDRQVDGLVLAMAPDTESETLTEPADSIPLVLVDRSLDRWQGDQVLADNEAGMKLAVQHLVRLGHRRIGLINGEDVWTGAHRRRGFEEALRAEGLRPDRQLISHGSFIFESGLVQASHLLGLADRPTAICAGNDLLAMATVVAAQEFRLSVPRDLSVVGYDDIDYARLISPGLTTVRQSATKMGAEAARLLLDRFNNNRTDDRTIVIRPSLVVRGSTAAVPASS